MSKIINKIVLSTKKAPQAIGPYSQAIKVDNTIYVSGQLGMKADTMKLVEGGVVKEARQALINLGHILKMADYSYDHVVKTTVLLQDIKDFEVVNKVYEEFFQEQKPARSVFQVVALPRGGKVEIEAVAFREKQDEVVWESINHFQEGTCIEIDIFEIYLYLSDFIGLDLQFLSLGQISNATVDLLSRFQFVIQQVWLLWKVFATLKKNHSTKSQDIFVPEVLVFKMAED